MISPDKDVIHRKSNHLLSHNDRISKTFHLSTLNTSRRLLRVSNTLIDAARLESVDVHAHPTVFHESHGVALLDRVEFEIVVVVRLVGATDFRSGVVDIDTVVAEAGVDFCKLRGLSCGSSEESAILSGQWRNNTRSLTYNRGSRIAAVVKSRRLMVRVFRGC